MRLLPRIFRKRREGGVSISKDSPLRRIFPEQSTPRPLEKPQATNDVIEAQKQAWYEEGRRNPSLATEGLHDLLRGTDEQNAADEGRISALQKEHIAGLKREVQAVEKNNPSSIEGSGSKR